MPEQVRNHWIKPVFDLRFVDDPERVHLKAFLK